MNLCYAGVSHVSFNVHALNRSKALVRRVALTAERYGRRGRR